MDLPQIPDLFPQGSPQPACRPPTSDIPRIIGHGRWKIIHDDWAVKAGIVPSKVQEGESYNEIKTAGKSEVAQLVGYGLGGVPFRYIAVGDDATANSPSQTALVAEITDSGLERVEATITNETTTTTGDTARFYHSWSVTGTKTIQEVALFTATPTGGVMLGRLLSGGQALYSGSTFQFTYDVIFA